MDILIYKTYSTKKIYLLILIFLEKLFGFEEKDKNLSQKSVFDLNFNDASYFE